MIPILEWDQRKATPNVRKHGVTFDEAASVFLDQFGLCTVDPDDIAGEERFVLLGMSGRLRLITVCFCERRRASVLRLISARKATRSEARMYGERLK